MFNIGNFLGKFKSIGLKEILIKDAIIKAVKDCTGGEIKRKDITFRYGVARIKTDPALKNQIYIRKEVIIDHLSEIKKEVKDIQ